VEDGVARKQMQSEIINRWKKKTDLEGRDTWSDAEENEKKRSN